MPLTLINPKTLIIKNILRKTIRRPIINNLMIFLIQVKSNIIHLLLNINLNLVSIKRILRSLINF